MKKHPIYRNLRQKNAPTVPILHIGSFTRQVPERQFEEALEPALQSCPFPEAEAEARRIRRLQEGIPILEEGKEPVLLPDSPASLMSRLYGTRTCILREYRFPEEVR